MRAAIRVVAFSIVLIAAGCGGGGGGVSGPTTRVVFEAVPAPGRELTDKDLERAAEIMRDRAKKLGIEATIERDEKQVAMELPRANIDRLVAVLTWTARLEFFDLQGDLVPGVSLDEQGFPRPSRKPPRQRPKTVIVTCGPKTSYCPGVEQEQPDRTYYYLFRYDPLNKEHPIPEMTGADLDRKGTRQDFDPTTNEPIVLMDFTEEGADKFHDITRRLVERGRVIANQRGWGGEENNLANQQFAIVLDDEVKSAPSVDFDENPNGIPGKNGAQITGIGSLEEARDLALVLQTGALPVAFRRVRE